MIALLVWLLAAPPSIATPPPATPQPTRGVDPVFTQVVDDILAGFRRSQAEVAKAYRYDPELVCRGAGLHGPVDKRATASALPLLRQHARSFLALQRAGIPVYAGFQIYISKRFKFIYLRQPKSSSSSIMAAIQALYCNGKVCSADQFRQVKSTDVDDATWTEYFVFTAVRNPIARAISTYVMFHTYFLFKRSDPASNQVGDPCGISFTEFTRDAFRLQAICDEAACCSFVRAGRNVWQPTFPAAHITQQAHSIFTAGGESVVDFIARTEHIGEDWDEIVRRIALRSRKQIGSVPIVNVNGHHDDKVVVAPEDRHPCLLPDVARLRLLNETTVGQVVRQFAMDMHLLKYLPTANDTLDAR